MKSALGRFALPLFVFVAGCGGGAHPKPAQPTDGTSPVAAPSDTSPTALVTGEAMPALTPVTAPPGLLAVGRVSNPARILDAAQAMPGARFDWRGILRREGFESALMLEAPIDFVVALDPAAPKDQPRPLWAATVPLKSVDAALAAAKEPSERVGPGVYRLGENGKCLIAASLGAAPARLVCSERSADANQLLPYATRGLPLEQLAGGDVHVELRPASAREMYAGQLRQMRTLGLAALLNEVQLGDARFDRALEEAARAVADEVFIWVDDLDLVTLDATLDRGTGSVAVTGEVRLKSDRSFVAQLGLDAAARGKGPPELFWKLPRASEEATYGRSSGAAKLDGVRKALIELSSAGLSKLAAPASVRTRVADMIDQTLSFEGTMVTAHGPARAPAAPADPANRLQELHSRLGWYLVGGDFPIKRPKALLDGLVKLYQDPALRADLKKRLGVDGSKALPVRVHATAGVKGGTTYEVAISNKEAGVKGPGNTTLVAIVIVADGAASWLAVAGDEGAAADVVRVALKGGDGLADVPGMQPVKAQTSSSGGFTLPLGSSTRLHSKELAGLGAALARAPHQGRTPVPFSATVTRENGVTYRWSLTFSRDTLEDFLSLASSVPGRTSGI